MVITKHACERYLERMEGVDTRTKKDMSHSKRKIINVIGNNKQKVLFKDDHIMYVLIKEMILVFDKEEDTLITLYPSTEKKVLSFGKLNEIELELEDILAGVCR